MEIGALTASLSSIDTQSQVGTKVLAMGLDDMEEQGDGIRKMLEMSVTPQIGSNFDVSV